MSKSSTSSKGIISHKKITTDSPGKPRGLKKMLDKLILPGLIDPHVHLRDPGQIHKEDFYTATCAALAGGYTTILDMPNNKLPITTAERLNEKIKIAKEKIVCDVGFYFGSMGDNLEEFEKIKDKVFGLKLYLNETTGNFLIDKIALKKIFISWAQNSSFRPLGSRHEKPILVHAEDKMLEAVIKLMKKLGNKVHICHISKISDLKQIIKAKKEGLRITCGVTPHHLFLTESDAKRLGPFGKMKPPLQSKKDQDFLWKNLKFIDVIESDHAPHTIEEKRGVVARGDTTGRAPDTAQRTIPKEYFERAVAERTKEFASLRGVAGKVGAGPRALNVPFGVPGLETTLPLLLTAASQKRLSIETLVRLCHTNPAKIFNIKTDPRTKLEINLNTSYSILNTSLFTKCHWSPFNDWKVQGKVEKVFIRGKKVFEKGKILTKPGFGKVLQK